ncbi:MAG: endopeptidase La [Gammaproteobacteria bacterium RIFCSPHIGHO2_12_FULL_45_9]|nr:MAG: endopeptidase La [Gammaproteobacteria bacterium RIFCSPHIGHO2_12_FULL_45_9]
MSEVSQEEITLPLLPLRDVVVFPHMVIPLFVGRSESVRALEAVMNREKQVFLIAQRDPNTEQPSRKDLYDIGLIATVLQMLRLPDGTVKVLVEGLERADLKKVHKQNGFFEAEVQRLPDQNLLSESETEALMRSVLGQFEELVRASKRLPPELIGTLSSVKEPSRLADNIASHLTVKMESRQQVLEAVNVAERLEVLHGLLAQEQELLEVEKRLQGRLRQQVEKNQRQYYLSEKMKAIQQELGELDEGGTVPDENAQLREKIEKAGMTAEAKEKALAEWRKLKMMAPMSAEATVCRNYLDWLLQVPWKARSKVSHDLQKAEAILEADHYGLEEVKQRILEYLAVQQRVKKIKGPILCLVGPPGVGKTSLGQSIANATGREFVRIALGGVRDEAEIRGHRRTYIGALPGKIIQKMAKTKVKNPLFMLDEVDKMAMDFRGDPASALLEVLDPEQNHAFNDHYLEVDYDLSDVMFIATANSMNIPGPLLDRMEIIRLPGYTEDEKLNIARKYLIPRQIEQAGLKATELMFEDSAIQTIIREYTREAGVRSLDREISKCCRKVVKEILSKHKKTASTEKKAMRQKAAASIVISSKNLEEYLGVKRYRFGIAENLDAIGRVTGLAWTEVGGELLTLEAQVMPGKGISKFTGHLGDVMKESIEAAMTVVRSRARALGIPDKYFQEHDFHVHVPEGATPKDGPSAGIGMCTALVSAITQAPVRADVAMTGEITLRGDVLPIGGLKEKLLAALRGGIKHVLIPEDNQRELKELPKNVIEQLKIHPMKTIDEVLKFSLEYLPKPKGGKAKKKSVKSVREGTQISVSASRSKKISTR